MPAQSNAPRPPEETPLQGWKEIAAYIERNQRTARRWEAEEGLPIRRHRTDRRSSVYAYPSEIDQWRVSRIPATTIGASARHPWVWAAVAALLLLGGFGLLLNSPGFDPIAEAGAVGGGVRTTEIRRAGAVGSLSPDGRYLSETDWVHSGDIGIRNLKTGEYRRLSDKGSWSAGFGEADRSIFSPDGRQIAYNWLTDRSGELRYELRVIDAFAEEPKARTVYFNEGLFYIQPDGWNPDGRLLVQFQRSDWSWGIGFVSIENGQLEVVKSVPSELSGLQLSHEGHWIAYSAAADAASQLHDIYLLASDGSAEKRAGDLESDEFVAGFSADDRTLLFISNRTGGHGLWGAGIDAEGQLGDPMLLVRDVGSVAPMGVLPDGSFIYQRAMGAVEIYSAELDFETGKLLRKPEVVDTEFHGENQGPWLSPDGMQFAYFAMPSSFQLGSRKKVERLRIHDLRSGEEREVVVEGARLRPNYGIAWSPDGKRLLATTHDQGRWGLLEFDIETGALTQVRGPDDPPSRPIGWSAAGREILYKAYTRETDGDGLSVYAIEGIRPSQSRGKRLYASRGLASAGKILEHALSHQRDRIAWREFAEPDEAIKVMSTRGGKAEIVFQPNDGWSARSLAWTPDGKTLLVQRRSSGPSREGGVWIIPLDGRQAFRSELSELYLKNLNVHPDGKTIYFQSGYRDPRIFKTENYLPADAGATE